MLRFLMQVTRVFNSRWMNVVMSTKAFRNGVILKTVVLHMPIRCKSVRALRFSKPAQIFWKANIGVLNQTRYMIVKLVNAW